MVIYSRSKDFYPRPPRGGRPGLTIEQEAKVEISIHALREEGDAIQVTKEQWTTYFYPRPPRGGRHHTWYNRIEDAKFLSTPSARRATICTKVFVQLYVISIHALREEGDLCRWRILRYYHIFLSTPSARRATPALEALVGVGANFYPRPPRGGRLQIWDVAHMTMKFLSTPSARRATKTARAIRAYDEISIHALREEGDEGSCMPYGLFSPFLSTPSARRATAANLGLC